MTIAIQSESSTEVPNPLFEINALPREPELLYKALKQVGIQVKEIAYVMAMHYQCEYAGRWTQPRRKKRYDPIRQ